MALLEEPVKEPRTVKNFIDGEWVDSSGPLREVINPATGRVVARVPISTSEETDVAIAAAQAAFPSWRATPPISSNRRNP